MENPTKIEINSNKLARIIILVSKIKNDIQFIFEKDKLLVQAMDDAYACMIEATLNKDAFSKYDVTIPFFITLNTKHMLEFMGTWKKEGLVRIDYIDGFAKFILKYDNAKLKERTIYSIQNKIIFPDEQTNAKLKFDFEIIMLCDKLKTNIVFAKKIFYKLELLVNNNIGLTIKAANELASFDFEIPKEEFNKFIIINNSRMLFSGELLDNFLSQLDKKDVLKILSGNHKPIKIILNPFEHVEIKYMQAPMLFRED